jgi:hypothetical protein
MGSWSPGALEKYQKDCVAGGGRVVPDPMMVSRCVVKPIGGPIPPGEKELHGTEIQNPQVIQPVYKYPPGYIPQRSVPHRSDTTTILIIILVLLVLFLGAGAVFLLMR